MHVLWDYVRLLCIMRWLADKSLFTDIRKFWTWEFLEGLCYPVWRSLIHLAVRWAGGRQCSAWRATFWIRALVQEAGFNELCIMLFTSSLHVCPVCLWNINFHANAQNFRIFNSFVYSISVGFKKITTTSPWNNPRIRNKQLRICY